jgi:peptide/nickel transport system permease protein
MPPPLLLRPPISRPTLRGSLSRGRKRRSSGRFRFIGRRLLQLPPSLLGILTVAFFVTRIIPGDPSYEIAGNDATQKTLQEIRVQYGFNESLLTQYWHYLRNLFGHFNFGRSIVTGGSVRSDLFTRLPSTLELVICSLAIALVLGVSVGISTAFRRGSVSDRASQGVTFVLLALPDFWVGIIAIYFFFFLWHIAPAPVGQLGIGQSIPDPITHAALLDSVLTLNGTLFLAALEHAAVPFLVLGILIAAPLARITRSSAIQTLNSDFVRYARACGLPERRIKRYVVRASIPPVLTLTGIFFTALLGSAVLIETIFSWQGAAQYAATAVQRKDYSAIQGFVVIAGTLSLITFLLVDVIHAMLDPRIRV